MYIMIMQEYTNKITTVKENRKKKGNSPKRNKNSTKIASFLGLAL